MTTDDQTGFEQWLTYTFDRPVADNGWDDNWDSDYYGPNDTYRVAYWTRMFEECDTVLSRFSDAQVAQGLRWMMSLSDQAHMLKENSASLTDRLRCIQSMQTLFEKCFAKRCSPQLSSLIPPEKLNSLNMVCYIWWDVLPIHGLPEHEPNNPNSAQLDHAILSVIKHILTIDSIPCQESALSGLIEWSGYYPEIPGIIDGFVAEHPEFWEQKG